MHFKCKHYLRVELDFYYVWYIEEIRNKCSSSLNDGWWCIVNNLKFSSLNVALNEVLPKPRATLSVE